MNKDKSTEARILNSSKEVFLMHGKEGTSMQQIADHAGINRTLLHYYFRSKDQLFEEVFKDSITKFFPEILNLMDSDVPILKKIEDFITNYIDQLADNPFIPMFILTEINRKPERIAQILQGGGINPGQFAMQIQQSILKGDLKPVDPRHLIINILSLCAFPFIARPLIEKILFNSNKQAYKQFLDGRKKDITNLVQESLRP